MLTVSSIGPVAATLGCVGFGVAWAVGEALLCAGGLLIGAGDGVGSGALAVVGGGLGSGSSDELLLGLGKGSPDAELEAVPCCRECTPRAVAATSARTLAALATMTNTWRRCAPASTESGAPESKSSSTAGAFLVPQVNAARAVVVVSRPSMVVVCAYS
jgi:hypothetical protein